VSSVLASLADPATGTPVALEVLQWILVGLVLLGAVPMVTTVYQFLLLLRSPRHDHYDDCDPDFLPRVVVLVPAWNEVAVLRYSVDAMMALDYPPERLRMAVVDDGSDDGTPELLDGKVAQYPGRVLNLRRENGGQGKAHTLNHGLALLLEDDWADAVLITDADVVFEPTSVRRMVRHLADERVGSVTAFILEASKRPNTMNRYIGYEYTAAQAASRRAQNVVGAQGCLAGGAQLHSRANLIELGGAIDTTTLAEDTVTTFETQLAGRSVVFDGNARCLAEEPGSVVGLWKQRLRWSRGNIQVARRFGGVTGGVFFGRSDIHRLGGLWFGLQWFATLLLPVLMIISSTSLVILWFINFGKAELAFEILWVTNAFGWLFTTIYTLSLDRWVARRTWFQAFTFPGLVNIVIMVAALAPRPTRELRDWALGLVGWTWSAGLADTLALFAYAWVALCMVAAYGLYRLEKWGRLPRLQAVLLVLIGYGPLLCAITFAAYVAEARGASIKWEKTEKVGAVGPA
jgi:cellulose synthase/poly-beta-1,6-N-acetylglucosamine synthase-like glycosyltransferase